jgi:DNA invertase Pin-like site-specific DNA recombinase
VKRAIGYRRVSTDGQGDSGAGLEAQQMSITREAEHKGFDLLEVATDIGSGKNMTARPELQRVLGLLAGGGADVLVVSKLDRLSRSMLDFASLMAVAQKQGWAVDVVELGFDTTTPNGKLVVNILMSLAEWERETIGARTKDALAAVKARGTKLGRPTTVDPVTVRTIRMLRDANLSYASIAASLNGQSVPTAQGGAKWYGSTVKAVLDRAGDGVAATAG